MAPRRVALAGLIGLLLAGAAVLGWGPGSTSGAAPAEGRPDREAAPPEALEAVLHAAPRSPQASADPASQALAPRDAAADIPEMDRLRLTAVDVATDTPAPGVRIVWLASRTEMPSALSPGTTSDASGNVTVPRSNLTRLAAVGPWRLLRRSVEESVADGRLLVLRQVRLRLRVEGEHEPARIEGWVECVPVEGRDREDRPLPFSAAWLDRFRLDLQHFVSSDTAYSVPWHPRWRVKAWGQGFVTDVAEFVAPAGGAADVVEVPVVLRPCARLRVTVRAPAGADVREAHLTCSIKVERPAALEWRPSVAKFGQGPPVWRRSRTERDAFVAVLTESRAPWRDLAPAGDGTVPSEGAVEFNLPEQGEMTLVTRLRGMLLDVQRLGPCRDHELVVTLTPATDRYLRFTRAGQPVRWVELVDVTDPELPVSLSLESVRDGLMPEGVLVTGRLYRLVPLDGAPRYLRADGRTEIDLDLLEQDEERFFRAPR